MDGVAVEAAGLPAASALVGVCPLPCRVASLLLATSRKWWSRVEAGEAVVQAMWEEQQHQQYSHL